MRAPSQAELLLDFAETCAATWPETRRYTDPDLTPAREAGEIDAAAMQRVLQSMPWLRAAGRESGAGEALSTTQLHSWFGRYITRYRAAGFAVARQRRLTDAAFARLLARGAGLRRHPWSRFAFARDARAALMFVAGEEYRCSLDLARQVCGRADLSLAPRGRSSRDLAVVRHLIDAGHLLPIPATARATRR
jgi:50S ribosomal protein L16 3-hydroxylase